MTRSEARLFLRTMKYVLADAGHLTLAWAAEDAEAFVPYMSLPDLHVWAAIALPAGRRGRAHLLLQSPYDARATALLFGILRSVEEEPMNEGMRALVERARNPNRLLGRLS